MDRLDLLFISPSLRKNIKKQVVAPLIITFDPEDSPLRTWIEEGIRLLPYIDVVYGKTGI